MEIETSMGGARIAEAAAQAAPADAGSPDNAANPMASAEEQDWKPSKHFLLAFMATLTMASAVAIESTSLPAALPIMSSELGGTALHAFWAGTSYLLASTVVQPTVASMSNTLGRKNMLYVASAGFAGGSLIAALAGNFSVVLVGRTIQGAGGGGLLVLCEILVSDLVPLAHRATWYSVITVMWSIGTVTGPLIGAGFAQNVTWRWIFWINLPIVGLGMVFVIFFLNQAKIPGHVVQKLMRFDWLGCVLFSVSTAGFLFGLTTGGVMFEWSSFRALIPLIAGMAGIVVFVYWEFYFASEPIIDKRSFENWTLVSLYAQILLHGMIIWAIMYFMVLYYQAVQFYDPVTSGLALLPETLTISIASVIVGAVCGYVKTYRWALWSGWALITLGTGLLYLLEPGTSVVQWVFLNVPVGIGGGMLFTPQILGLQAATRPELNGQAAALFSFIRILGQSLGVAISGVIFQNVFRQKLEAIPAFSHLAYEYSRDATIVVEVIKEMPDSVSKSQIVQAYSNALKALWLALLAFSALGLLLSFTVKAYTMAQEHVTKQELVGGEKSKQANLESGIFGEPQAGK